MDYIRTFLGLIQQSVRRHECNETFELLQCDGASIMGVGDDTVTVMNGNSGNKAEGKRTFPTSNESMN